jgi:hypothetical protein
MGFKSREGYSKYRVYKTSGRLQEHGRNSFEATKGGGGAQSGQC